MSFCNRLSLVFLYSKKIQLIADDVNCLRDGVYAGFYNNLVIEENGFPKTDIL